MQVDALRVELPPSQPVKKEAMESFDKVKQAIIMKLDVIPFPLQQESVATL